MVSEEKVVKVSSVVKASPRKLKLIANLLKGKDSVKASNALDVDKRRVSPLISKAIKNGVHLLKKTHSVEGENSFIKEAFVGKFKAIKKIRRYAKGRASYGKSFLTRITMLIGEKNEKV